MMDTATVDLDFPMSTEALPAMPGIALEVIRQTEQAEVDLQGVAETVGRDPALAVWLLKLSNSPLFGRSHEVTSINQALMVLGLKAVKMAAISFSMSAVLGANSANGMGREEDFHGFWRRSVASAVAARELVATHHPKLADEAFLCGLLQDVGFAALLNAGHGPYSEALPSIDSGHPSTEAERQALGGHTHADVGAHILEAWNISPLLVQPVRFHHDVDAIPEDAPEDVTVLTRALNLAHEVATTLNSEGARGQALAAARHKALKWYGIDAEAFDDFIEGLTEDVHAMANVMDIDIASPEEMALTMMRAQEDMLTLAVGAQRELQTTRSRVEELRAKAETDALTGIRNRAAYDEIVAEHWGDRVTGASKAPIGLILGDVDRFKLVNDTYGHQAGDEVLKHVARSLEKNCRQETDVACRYGGEEFVVIVSGASKDEFKTVAERLRSGVEAMTVSTDQGQLSVTASFGGAWLGAVPAGVTAGELLESADRNLYEAKEAGRDRCVVGPLQG